MLEAIYIVGNVVTRSKLPVWAHQLAFFAIGATLLIETVRILIQGWLITALFLGFVGILALSNVSKKEVVRRYQRREQRKREKGEHKFMSCSLVFIGVLHAVFIVSAIQFAVNQLWIHALWMVIVEVFPLWKAIRLIAFSDRIYPLWERFHLSDTKKKLPNQ